MRLTLALVTALLVISIAVAGAMAGDCSCVAPKALCSTNCGTGQSGCCGCGTTSSQCVCCPPPTCPILTRCEAVQGGYYGTATCVKP